MEKPKSNQLQNVAFTVIVLVACILIYLLIGKSASVDSSPEASAAVVGAGEFTAQPETEETKDAAFEAVPGELYGQFLREDGRVSAKKDRKRENAYSLVCGSQTSGTGELTYTVSEDTGRVTSLTLSFPCRDKPPSKPKTDIEKRLAADYPKHIALQNTAVDAMLRAAIQACDLNGALIDPVLTRWYAGALMCRDDDKTFTDAYAGCDFSAFRSSDGGKTLVVCTLLLP